MRAAMLGDFVLPGGVGFCNAVRRTLLSDIESDAPCHVTVHDNGSCYTDEFLAHRIGLVPLRRIGPGDTLRLEAVGPCVVRASDMTSPSFEAVHGDIEIVTLDGDQKVTLTVHVDRRPAHAHARYAVCAGVGMSSTDRDGVTRLVFSTNDDRDPDAVLTDAFDHLDARVQRALHALAHQPAEPPTSFC